MKTEMSIDLNAYMKEFKVWSGIIAPKFKNWGVIQKDLASMCYFTTPASSSGHLSVTGGLLAHSVEVANTMFKFRHVTIDRVAQVPWKMAVVGLLHDVGKCGLANTLKAGKGNASSKVVQPRYVKTHISDAEYGYSKRESTPHFELRDLSALYAAKWGLPWDVVQAIMCHDGEYVGANKPYARKLTPLAMLVNIADTWSAQVMEGKSTLNKIIL